MALRESLDLGRGWYKESIRIGRLVTPTPEYRPYTTRDLIIEIIRIPVRTQKRFKLRFGRPRIC
jgi:hypothetical protein